MKDAGSMVWDYLVFLIFIVATTFVAVYNRSGPKEKTKADYVFATGQKVSMAAMMLSIARGTLGVRSFLGKFAYRNNIILISKQRPYNGLNCIIRSNKTHLIRI